MKPILNFKTETLDIKEVGSILEIKKSIAKISGLPSCIFGQLILLKSGQKGLVMSFNEKEVTALILGNDNNISAGDEVISKAEPFSIPVGRKYLGRVVNCLGEPCDGERIYDFDDNYPVFKDAPPVIDRTPLEEVIHTGIKAIDTMLPLAKGQRELIIGDRMTGKTTIAIDTIINQWDKDIICIYCFIGKSEFSLAKTVQLLKTKGAMDYTVIVAATASAPPGERYLAPYTACTLGEYYMNNGRDVLIVFDDLTRHAWVYRQISLLLGRPPGREAYPGDVFYIHSQLVERAGKFNEECGGGSMTFLPILETQQGDITDHISSNVISMTDGQIYTSTSLFNEGFKPSIDLGLSVSRIGNKIQCKAMKEVSGSLKLEFLQHRELVRLTRMKGKVSDQIEKRLKKGDVLRTLITQDRNNPISLEEQIIIFYSYHSNILQLLPKEGIHRFQMEIFSFIKETHPEIITTITNEQVLSDTVKKNLNKSFIDFVKRKGIL